MPPNKALGYLAVLQFGRIATAGTSWLGDLCHRQKPCVDEARCMIDPQAPLIGRPFCICPHGFDGDGRLDGDGCLDINECEKHLSTCRSDSEICENTIGGFKCSCKPGFERKAPDGPCQDINECFNPNICRGESICVNTPGSYSCICIDPYKEFSTTEGCVARDVCNGNNGELNPCDPINGRCINTINGPECVCKEGYRLIDGKICQDIDECTQLERCPVSSVCVNEIGGYRCQCDEHLGYTNAGPHQCKNLNECEQYPEVCSDPLFNCCMDLPPPRKFVCSPSLASFAQNPSGKSLHNPVPSFTSRDPILQKSLLGRLIPSGSLLRDSPSPFSQAFLSTPAIEGIRGRSLENIAFEEKSMVEQLWTKFSEELVGLVPLIPRPTRNIWDQPHYPPSACPAGFVNVEAIRQKLALRKVPEAASHFTAFLKELLPFAPGKVDPNSVAVGIATNVNAVVNDLMEWYRAFVALPEAIEGAASNATKVDLKQDLKSVVSAGAQMAQPMISLLDGLGQRSEDIPHIGSGPIFAPIANAAM